jgi:hypothetical protein
MTWTSGTFCPAMNRVFRVNDTLVFASGSDIWKYSAAATSLNTHMAPAVSYSTVKINPTVASDDATAIVDLKKPTHLSLILINAAGVKVRDVENDYKPTGTYQYRIDTKDLPNGMYFLSLRSYEDMSSQKMVVKHE